MDTPALTASQARVVTAIRAELARLMRYDDESIVHDHWIRQRYDGFYAASYLPARTAAVVTAWHEAGHARGRAGRRGPVPLGQHLPRHRQRGPGARHRSPR